MQVYQTPNYFNICAFNEIVVNKNVTYATNVIVIKETNFKKKKLTNNNNNVFYVTFQNLLN